MVIGNFSFNVPQLVHVLVQYWIIFIVLWTVFWYLDKPLTLVWQMLFRSAMTALAVWFLMVVFACIHLSLNDLKGIDRHGFSTSIYAPAAAVFG